MFVCLFLSENLAVRGVNVTEVEYTPSNLFTLRSTYTDLNFKYPAFLKIYEIKSQSKCGKEVVLGIVRGSASNTVVPHGLLTSLRTSPAKEFLASGSPTEAFPAPESKQASTLASQRQG